MSQANEDHDPARDLPGTQSDQNREEGQSGLREDGTHPEPSGKPGSKSPNKDDSPDSKTGAAGEGSQSTGHRQNAG